LALILVAKLPTGITSELGTATTKEGQATFEGMKIKDVGDYSLEVVPADKELPFASASSPIAVTMLGAHVTQLAWSVLPPTAVWAGEPFSASVVEQSPGGSTVLNANDAITLYLDSSYVLGGPQSPSAGVVNFSGMIVGEPGDYTLTGSTTSSGVTATSDALLSVGDKRLPPRDSENITEMKQP